MKKLLIALLMIMPVWCHATTRYVSDFHTSASIIAFVNCILLVSSIVCIIQYYFGSRDAHMSFHFLNMIFIILFYWISITFLITHRHYYDGYEFLTPAQCIKKLFFTWNRYVIKHWVIFFAFLINILYIARAERAIVIETE